jgi:hypothetical protein
MVSSDEKLGFGEKGEEQRSAMSKLNMVTNEVYKICLNKILSQKKKKSKQNLGMPEDNWKSIVQAIFLLTREMLCQRI